MASAANAPVQLTDAVALKWQGGVFLFTQNYDQMAVNSLAPFLLSPQLGFPVQQYSPTPSLDDLGIGLFGQAVFTLRDRLDLTVGAPLRPRSQGGACSTRISCPPIAPPTHGQRRRELFELLAAGGGRLSRAAGRHGLRLGQRGLQGRRLEPSVARGQ